MTLSEFKAWFEGFTESMDGAPSEKQFKRIKAKVAEITGTPITQTVFVDRYRDYHRYWGQPAWYGISGNVAQSTNSYAQAGNDLSALGSQFDSHSAMYAVGKTDALAS